MKPGAMSVLADQVMTFPRIHRAVGNNNAGVFCSYLLLYCETMEDGRIRAGTPAEIYDRVALSEKEQASARRRLQKLGVVTAADTAKPPAFFRLNDARLCELLDAIRD